MKTLIVTLEYPPQTGGVANYVHQFAKHQPADSVVVVAPEVKGGAAYDQTNPWKTIRVKPYFPLVWPSWLRLLLRVRTIIKQEGITHLHLHHVLPVGYIAYWLKKRGLITAYQVFLHGTDVTFAFKTPAKMKWFQKICGAAEQVVVNSVFLQHKIAEFCTAPVKVIHPCPAENFFAEPNQEAIIKLRAHLALSGKKVLLTVGRMVEGKGFPHCVRLLPQILRQVPNTVWLMVGNGPKRNDIIALVQKNNLQNAVRFLGEVSQENLPIFYELADAFVLLTHPDNGVEESWGTVLMEAAAAGLPTVVGRSGGTEEAVLDNVTGHVVDVYQDEQVVEAITTLLLQPEVAKAMGAKGQARVRQDFTWEKQLAKLS